MGDGTVHIGELSSRTGASRRSLRHYEQHGLLPAGRTEAGWRTYDERAVHRVRTVRQLLDAGMTVDDIRTVVPCLDVDDPATCDDPEPAIALFRSRLAVIDARLARLQEHRDRLAGRIAHLRGQR